MQGLSIEEVIHVADLANLTLTEEEKKKFACQLQDILSSGVKMLVISFAVAEKQSIPLLISVPSNIEVEV